MVSVNAPVVRLSTQYCCTVAGTTTVRLPVRVPVKRYATRLSSLPVRVYVPVPATLMTV
jgi:hypothetical protein